MFKAGELSVDEVKETEFIILKCIQFENFQDKNTKFMKDLQVFPSEKSLMRIKTNIVLHDEFDGYKYLMLLPFNHLIVQHRKI